MNMKTVPNSYSFYTEILNSSQHKMDKHVMSQYTFTDLTP